MFEPIAILLPNSHAVPVYAPSSYSTRRLVERFGYHADGRRRQIGIVRIPNGVLVSS